MTAPSSPTAIQALDADAVRRDEHWLGDGAAIRRPGRHRARAQHGRGPASGATSSGWARTRRPPAPGAPRNATMTYRRGRLPDGKPRGLTVDERVAASWGRPSADYAASPAVGSGTRDRNVTASAPTGSAPYASARRASPGRNPLRRTGSRGPHVPRPQLGPPRASPGPSRHSRLVPPPMNPSGV